MRRFAALLGLAVLGQVALAGWLAPCHERGAPRAAVDGHATHHHGSAPDEAPTHGVPQCMASPACTVVMLGAPLSRCSGAHVPSDFDLGVASPPLVAAMAPESPPPRG